MPDIQRINWNSSWLAFVLVPSNSSKLLRLLNWTPRQSLV